MEAFVAEQIYTIPINEAFDQALADEKPDCPFCKLWSMLEKNALEAVMGAAMMEPDVRIETNRRAFAACISTRCTKWEIALAWGLYSRVMWRR